MHENSSCGNAGTSHLGCVDQVLANVQKSTIQFMGCVMCTCSDPPCYALALTYHSTGRIACETIATCYLPVAVWLKKCALRCARALS